MSENRFDFARQIADQLFAAETAIDTALAKTAALAGLMPSVREDARLSALVGQGAIERAIETMAALGEARRKIVETHKQLSITQKQIGLGPVNFGGWVDKPQFAREGLRPVAVEAA
jgi:hypothetical protein